MISKIFLLLFILMLGFGLSVWDMLYTPQSGGAVIALQQREMEREVPQGDPIPDAAFLALDGTPYKLHDFKGKTIILNFWATWCAPCVEEFPDLVDLAARSQNKVVLIALSVDADENNIRAFLEKFPRVLQSKIRRPNIVIAQDRDKHISQDLFQTVLYPESFIIGPDLRIRQKISGATDWNALDTHLFSEENP